MKKNDSNLQIVEYRPELKKHFITLNLEWLEEYFEVEPHDKEVLYDCEERIVKAGGFIFFLQKDDDIIGTYAYIPVNSANHTFELTKMAVSSSYRGRGYGTKLLEHAMSVAKNNSFQTVILYSNRRLQNAIHLYKKFGFEEIKIEENQPYSRGDIKMKRTHF